MKRKITSLLLLLAVSIFVSAHERQLEEKLQIARSVLTRNNLSKGKSFNDIKILKNLSGLSIIGYENGGFAIVSNNDNNEQVLGWSAGCYNEANRAEGFSWWLTAMDEVLQNSNNAVRDALPKNVATEIQPLLTTEWGQWTPYNNMCPVGCPSGCVATSMAQVINYNKYPVNGKGSYIDMDQAIFVDFSSATYDYANMGIANYAIMPYNQTQADAVALLMYHCGIAAKMNYTPSGSSTRSLDATKAMREYFKYNTNITTRLRDFYKSSLWMKLLYNELNAGRPVIYAGDDANNNGGHSFVIDGYNADGLVHVNWGWDGSNNGYYDISLLNPSEYEFSQHQDMITGAALLDVDIRHDTQIITQSDFDVTLSNNVLTTNWAEDVIYNGNDYSFDGTMYCVLINTATNEIIKIINKFDFSSMNIPSLNGIKFNSNTIYNTALDELSLSDGVYWITRIACDKGHQESSQIYCPDNVIGSYYLYKEGDNYTLKSEKEVSTGIKNIISTDSNTSFKDRIYTIDGRNIKNINETSRGIYIKGGKAFIKK
ncbi:MAG: C10 family peptidase [Prevotella sp.]